MRNSPKKMIEIGYSFFIENGIISFMKYCKLHNARQGRKRLLAGCD